MPKIFGELPMWAWVFLPAIALMLVTYLFTQNRKFATNLGVSAIILSLLTTGLQLWQVYLAEHFLGGFNEYGLPANFSRNGWGLMWDALPLWLVPTLIFALLAIFFTLTFKIATDSSSEIQTQPLSPSKPEESEIRAGMTDADLLHALEIQKLKRELAGLKTKLQQANHDSNSESESSRAARFKKELTSVIAQNKQYELQIQHLKEDLKKNKDLVEQLLSERMDLNLPSDEEPEDTDEQSR